MAITTQAKWFLHAYRVLRDHDLGMHEQQRLRARQHNLEHPNKPPIDQIGIASDQFIGTVDFVCLAFSVELYLKALFEALGFRQKGHNIRSLFEKLPVEVQTMVFKKHMRDFYNAKLNDYIAYIDVISKGFEEFRYSYEHSNLQYHQDFALGLIDAVDQIIEEVRKK